MLALCDGLIGTKQPHILISWLAISVDFADRSQPEGRCLSKWIMHAAAGQCAPVGNATASGPLGWDHAWIGPLLRGPLSEQLLRPSYLPKGARASLMSCTFPGLMIEPRYSEAYAAVWNPAST